MIRSAGRWPIAFVLALAACERSATPTEPSTRRPLGGQSLASISEQHRVTNNDLDGVWGTSSSDVFVVGANGTILHYDGRSWTAMESGTTQGLYAVWGSSSNDVYAVGYGGTVLHYDGTSWSSTPIPYPRGGNETRDLYAVWGTGPNDIFIGGANGAMIHWDGSRWNYQAIFTSWDVQSVWGSSPTNVYAVDADGKPHQYDGRAWRHYDRIASFLYAVWATPEEGYGFAVGLPGDAHWHVGFTNNWARLFTGVSLPLYGIWGTSRSDIFAVGWAGKIIHYNGQYWEHQSSGVEVGLRAVWGSSSTDVFAVGYGGTIVHYDGRAWSEEMAFQNQPPIADAGPDQTVECRRYLGTALTVVELHGDGSSDSDGMVASHEWFQNGTLVNTGERVAIPLSLGAHTITLRVSDGDGAYDEDDAAIIVHDTQSPTIDMAVSPTVLNASGRAGREMHRVAARISASDGCDLSPSLTVTVTSNEPQNGLGDGDTSPDWEVVSNGDGTFDVWVRAERSGTGHGRVYTITATATDGSGNAISSSATVTVPHDNAEPVVRH